MSVPNAISIGRLLAVPVFVWLILSEALTSAFWLFLAAGISDAVDGTIARYCNARTKLGAFLDPLADKALLVSAYIVLGHMNMLPTWLVILVVFRDLLIIGGALLFETVTQSLEMEPLMVSKLNTGTQLTLVAMVLAAPTFGLEWDGIQTAFCYIVAATTAVSGAAYVYIWTRRAAEYEARDESE